MSDPLVLADETLEDGPVDFPDGSEARAALIDQRFVHGLLRAMTTADAATREARVQAIMARISASGGPSRWRPLAVAAAALVLAALGTWLLVPGGEGLPRVEAAVDRALRSLEEPRDHRYAVTLTVQRGRERKPVRREYELVVRQGERFRLEGRGVLGPFVAGSDGETVWFSPRARWMRWSRSHPGSMRLGALLAVTDVESSDLELRRLIEGLQRRAERVRVREVAAPPGGGGPRTRVEALDVERPRGRWGGGVLQRLSFEVEDRTGILRRIEVQRRHRGWNRHVLLEWRGTERVGEDGYRRPW